EDKVTTTNPDVWRNMFNKTRLTETLKRQLETEYLFLDQPGNWLELEAEDFVEKACEILAAEWQRFTVELEVEIAQYSETSMRELDLKGSLERIVKEALSTVRKTVMKMVKDLTILVFIIFESLIALIFLIIT